MLCSLLKDLFVAVDAMMFILWQSIASKLSYWSIRCTLKRQLFINQCILFNTKDGKCIQNLPPLLYKETRLSKLCEICEFKVEEAILVGFPSKSSMPTFVLRCR